MHDFVFGARSYLCRSAHLVTCCHIKVMMYVQVHYYIANSTMGWSQGQKERESDRGSVQVPLRDVWHLS